MSRDLPAQWEINYGPGRIVEHTSITPCFAAVAEGIDTGGAAGRLILAGLLERRVYMDTIKVTISLVPELLDELDRLVREGIFASRSEAIQQALREKLSRWVPGGAYEGFGQHALARPGTPIEEAQGAEPADWQDVEG